MKTTKRRKIGIALIVAGALVLTMSGSAAFAGEIALKDVNSTNYFKYVKLVRAAYGFNKGECNREYLPHEEHFYSEYYDHWNVDVVYDRKLIHKLYTTFEKKRPVIKKAVKKGQKIHLSWKGVKGAKKYAVYVKCGKGQWKTLGFVNGNRKSITYRSSISKGIKCKYRIQGIKHVRLWDVKTKHSKTVHIIN